MDADTIANEASGVAASPGSEGSEGSADEALISRDLSKRTGRSEQSELDRTLSPEELALESTDLGLPRAPQALLDRFESFRLLGRGGMGVVFRARDKALGRDVAVKLLVGADAQLQSRLLREARSQARIAHENVCEVYEVGAADGQGYLVMQCIEGQPFDERCGHMTVEEKARVVRQVALALHEAHKLGIVHRDVKPSNILVAPQGDGSFKPYILDFGIARDLTNRGQTQTGILSGTPSFMAPEQARGEVRSLDRRTDVYGLGATLYCVLAGNPPFGGTTLFEILKQITAQDARPLRELEPAIPEDLEAITMKCLEKTPAQRYDSARALAEDLGRFLEGEPVEARPRSLRYVLVKKAKRYKAWVGLAAAALVVLMVGVALWARSRRIAAEEAAQAASRSALAEQLGENVKEMELFLRSAYGMPLHDIERERKVVRQRLAGVRERMAAAGPLGEGPGSYALGRGYLALREVEPAITHFRRAIAAGYAPPSLHYSMGLALGEVYRKALEEADQIEDPGRKKERVAVIEAQYKEPALQSLRAALGATLEEAAYVEGLVALYEGRYDAALEKAKEAFEKAPWLYEAKLLEGYALFEEGSKWRHDAAFDYDRMAGYFSRASSVFHEAADVARSDSRVYEAECDLWTQMMLASGGRGDVLRSSFEKARLACDKAAVASPNGAGLGEKQALVYQGFAFQLMDAEPANDEVEPRIEEAIRRAEEAARRSPEAPMAHYVRGAAWRTRAMRLLNNGLDAHPALEQAATSYNEAIRLSPTLVWAHNELCSTYAERARVDVTWGEDPTPSVDAAVAQCDRALSIDPGFVYALVNKANAHYRAAQWLAAKGRPPDPAVKRVLEASAVARERSPGSLGPPVFEAWTHLLVAAFESEAGRDPGAAMKLAEERAAEVEKLAPSSGASLEIAGMVGSTRAADRVRRGVDPGEALVKAADAFRRLGEESPWDVDFRLARARVGIIASRWALQRGRARASDFTAAEEPLRPLLEKKRSDPRLSQALAEIEELRALWLASRGRPGVKAAGGPSLRR